ncbi:hypothetical protein ROM27_05855 [Cronobacter malonaticus]|uniref:hypothetical protein n=1 Tax=Cronobacter malonaticus TaxID=413503 RepID=UPI002895C36F|nr:hypothetical protein [Cronobacter malonaticus]MDT3563813.1 hypothetical protein [Cronobacter malonaticus]
MDNSREQFDQWLKQQGLKPVAWIKDEYWKVWKASRAAVEIDAPAEPFYPMPINSCPTDHYHYGRESVISKVRAAGLKVKGE